MEQDLNAQHLSCGGLGDQGFEAVHRDNKVPTFSTGFKDLPLGPVLEIPDTEEGYFAILKEKFNFIKFYNGQLDAIKSLLQDKANTMIIL